MSDTLVLANAAMVLADRIVTGWVAVAEGRIAAIGEGPAPSTGHGAGIDLGGDYLIPGLVELHTDHLEAHIAPRPGVRWNPQAAVAAYDGQIALSGITTVFDSFRVGTDADSGALAKELPTLIAAVRDARSHGLLRARHLTHLRCEVCAPDVLAEAAAVVGSASVQLMSLMDHTPGARQFRDIASWKRYYGGKSTMTATELDAFIGRRQEMFEANHDRHRSGLVALAKAHGIALASHDDATSAHVALSIENGVALAEFPTTLEAARHSHDAGIRVMMGAPNLVLGGSQSGNIAAVALADAGCLDILSSDYVPASLLVGAFTLAQTRPQIGLAQAVRTVSLNPAQAVGLDDRGQIAIGKLADLVRVREVGRLPSVLEVYRGGQRVV